MTTKKALNDDPLFQISLDCLYLYLFNFLRSIKVSDYKEAFSHEPKFENTRFS